MSDGKAIGEAMRITAAVLWVPALILIITLFVKFIKRRHEIGSKLKSAYRLSVTIFVFVITAGINFFYVHLIQGLGQSEPAILLTIGSMVGIVSLMMEFVFIQCIFVNRLSIVFRNSQFDYPQWFYRTMYIFIILMVISVFIGELSGFPIIKGFALFAVILNCMFLTVLYIYSLKKVLKSENERSLTSDENQNDDLPINIMIKYIVLLSFSMTSSAIFGFFIMAQDLESVAHISINGTVWILQSIDSSINIICVYFQFKIFEESYFRLFGTYHNWIGSTFFGRTKQAIVDAEMLSNDIDHEQHVDVDHEQAIVDVEMLSQDVDQ